MTNKQEFSWLSIKNTSKFGSFIPICHRLYNFFDKLLFGIAYIAGLIYYLYDGKSYQLSRIADTC